jgi:Fic/DOC family
MLRWQYASVAGLNQASKHIRMNPIALISAHVPSYDQIATLRPDVVGLIDETWKFINACVTADCGESTKKFTNAQMPIDTAEAKFLRKLRHPLSTRALARAGMLSEAPTSPQQRALVASKLEERNSTELETLKKFERELLISLSPGSVDHFVHVLECVVSDFLSTSVHRRTTPAFIVPDAQGVGWQCPRSEEMIPRLAELHQYISSNADRSPLQTAIVALVMLSCIHPFMDGNGRLSRVVFHAILRKSGSLPEFYIPLKDFYALSAFGFEIRLRHTFLTSDWAEIMVYFCNVLRWHSAGSIGQNIKPTPHPL